MKIILLLMVILLIGCVGNSDKAERYKLDLQYYDYALELLDQGLNVEAYDSCNRTWYLKNECLISIVQTSISNESKVYQDWCNEIEPEYKIRMNMHTFEMVYTDIDDDLNNEIQQKRNPSKERRERILNIKEECLKIAQ